jgi:hypothetical protein
MATRKAKSINPLKVSDGYPRLVLVATPGPDGSDPALFTVTVTGHNLDDPVLALDMVKDVLPHLVRSAHEHLHRAAYAAGHAAGLAAAQSPDEGD